MKHRRLSVILTSIVMLIAFMMPSMNSAGIPQEPIQISIPTPAINRPRESGQNFEQVSRGRVTCECCRPASTGALEYFSSSDSVAPGYCPSTGGSIEYEFIQDVKCELKPSRTLTITVSIWIANPTGCVVGEPCPEYDASPEYVNAWIDWDGDKVWENNEKVLDEALTGYQAINYRGGMTTSTIVTIPTVSVASTWMRVNLGWGYDPNNPCELTWNWGNVVDKEVSVKLPKIEKITVTGIPDAKNPTTNCPSTAVVEKVKLEAAITPAEGFEVTKVSWSGDIKPGEGNPYEYEAAPSTHGKKKVECTITFKHKVTGDIGTDKNTKEFKLFFVKDGQDDGPGTPPNWFKYWGQIEPSRASSRIYSSTWTGSGCRAAATWDTGDQIIIYRVMSTDVQYCCSKMAHENKHHDDFFDVVWSGAGYNQAQDGDRDWLRDAWETANGFDPTVYDWTTFDNNWFNPRAYAVENNYPDVSNRDWAHPGAQSDGDPNSDSDSGYTMALEPTAEFTGKYSDHGRDTNGDGLYDYLTIEVEVNVTGAREYHVTSVLYDRDGNEIIWADNITNLSIGIQSLKLNFDGQTIYKHGIDGPYDLRNLGLCDDENWITEDYVFDAYNTSEYDYTEFQRPTAEFTGEYSDYGRDADGDGLHNYLAVEVPVDVTIAGNYAVEGWLHDSNGNNIMMATNSTYLYVGDQRVTLNFDGLAINWHRMNGPYNLRYLSLYSGNGNLVDFILNAYNTSAYKYTDFQKTNAGFSGFYSDYGKDTDSDGLYNYLTLRVGIDVAASGNYALMGSLYDGNGGEIIGTMNFTHLNSGNQSVLLDFDGAAIYKHGMDGPYHLRYLALYDENGTLKDTIDYAYTTSAYDHSNFQYLVLLTEVYSDFGKDIDGDGLYNYLTVNVGAKVAADGNCFVYGRLMDAYETEIGWASNATFLYADQIQTIQLSFDGKSIHENMVDGPYNVRDVYIYHQGDPTTSDYVQDAYTTNAYNYIEFQPKPPYFVQWSRTYGGYGHSQFAQPIGDLDGDGVNEVVVGGYETLGNGRARIISYDTNLGTYVEEYNWTEGGGTYNSPSGATMLDLDGDAKLELVMSWAYCGSNDGLWAYKWNGATLTKLDHYYASMVFDVYTCDYDDDSINEVLVANEPSGGAPYHVIALGWNRTSNKFVVESTWALAGYTSMECPMVWSGDIDNDGKTEVAAVLSSGSSSTAGVWALHWNSGLGQWSAQQIYAGPFYGTPYGVAVGDLDGDGVAEIGVGNNVAGYVGAEVYLFDWNGTVYQVVWHGSWPTEKVVIEAVAIGDVDNDGVNEFCVGTNTVHIIQWNGTDYAEEFTLAETAGLLCGLNVGDCDTDGLNELVAHDILDIGPGDEWIFKFEEHNIAITNILCCKTIIGQGYCLSFNVTVANQGYFSEVFNVSVYANTTFLAKQPNIVLTKKHTTMITFTWNTTGFAYGNYTLSAYEAPVPGENYTLTGWVIVTIPGDVKGDGIVDIYDAILLAGAYNSQPGTSAWNPNADIKGDNIVDIYDAIILASNYGKNV